VHDRHADVHQHHGRGEPVDQRQHLGAVARLAHHPQVGGAAQHHHQACADQRVVVDHQHADRLVR
jgi:hypothetical protein